MNGAMTTRHEAVDAVESEFTRLGRTMESVARSAILYGGLDRASYLILRTLADSGSGAVNQLADRLGLDGSTMTRQTAALETRGLVTRTPDPEDRRSSIVALTPDGRATMEETRRHRQEQIRDLFAEWSEEELAELGRVLTHLNLTLTASATVLRRRR